MSTTHIVVHAPAEAIFDLLIDPPCYPAWVVGARDVRDVDPAWPAEGTSFHHSVGLWPFVVKDSTTIVVARRPDLVELRARAWPLGEADVRIELEQRGDRTRVTMREIPVAGPGRGMWSRPVEALTTLRNRLSLSRLKRLVASRRAGRAAA